MAGWDAVRIHPYVHPLHWKGLKHFIRILKENVIQSEVDPGLNHVVVVCFVPIYYCQELAKNQPTSLVGTQ